MKYSDEKMAELFERIISLKHDIQGLAGYVQNPLPASVELNLTTINDIRESIEDMNLNFDSLISELQILKEEASETIQSFCDAN